MLERYKAIYAGGEGELIEKKSRFITSISPVENEAQALEFIESKKKQHWNASHNCFAFVIGKNQEVKRCSDDGEPSQTAGAPMLNVLLGEEIHNVCVVVTRYFGGTLLGTGGLVRAYSNAVSEGLRNCVIVEKQLAKKLRLQTDYNNIGKIQYLLGQMEVTTISSEYTDRVQLIILVPVAMVQELGDKIVGETSGRTQIEEGGQVYFCLVGGEVMIFD